MPDGPDGQDELPTTSLSTPPVLPPDPRLLLGPGFVAPLAVGRPAWRRHHTRAAVAVHAAAVACVPVLLLLSHGAAVPALTVGVLLTVAGRAVLRWRLRLLRRRGRGASTLLAVGALDDLAALIERTRDAPGLGWHVLDVCTSTGAGPAEAPGVAGVRVTGDLDAVAHLAGSGRYDAVAVTPGPGWTSVRLQQLADAIDGTRTALLVDPRMVPRTGPRLRVTGVDGLPLLRLHHPALSGPRRLVKETLDRLAATAALLVTAPLLLGCAVAVRRDGGPALQRRTRPGRGGRAFGLLTFRTHDATGALTPAGRVLHRHRLHGLPQLLNVLGGSMAIVGPRPARAGRPLVKPGLTGLPSTDGDPELRYVERWTPLRDARILLRTLGVRRR